MFEKYVAAALVFMVVVTAVASPLFAGPKSQKKSEIEKMMEKVAKLGVGKKVELTLRQNGAKTKGTITRLDATGFTVAEKRSGMALTFTYAELKNIKGGGSVMKWVIVGGVAAAIVVGVYASALCENEGC